MSGFGGTAHNDHTAYIELASVAFASGAISGSFSSGTLTVSSGATVVAEINFAGSYATSNFHFTSGSGGSVEITDPGNDHRHHNVGHTADLALLGNYIASFAAGGYGGYVVAGVGQADPAQPLLVHPHQ